MVRSVKLHVPNFHNYIGARVVFRGRYGPWPSRSRLTLMHEEWRIYLDQDPQLDQRENSLRANGGYAMTHVGIIERADGRAFRRRDIEDLSSCLHRFLSFARGFWCGPLVLEGMGRRGALWTEWSSEALLTDWQGVASWFPLRDVSEVTVAFDGFCELWNRPLWKRPLAGAVHWYIEANLNAGAIEGSLILAHTTLELLAWIFVVGDRGVLSASHFDKLSSQERLRELLSTLRIPTAIPASLQAVWKWAAATRPQHSVADDGPSVITRMRNALVHPKPARRSVLEQASGPARVQARQLALLYVELVILALSGYRGKFINRLRTGVTPTEATAVVPWADRAPFTLDHMEGPAYRIAK
jgi:hypothetical protein